jgi:hypothetical protein
LDSATGQARLALALGAGRVARLGLVGLTFYGLGREDIGHVPAALAGLWLARLWLLRRCGGLGHAA